MAGLQDYLETSIEGLAALRAHDLSGAIERAIDIIVAALADVLLDVPSRFTPVIQQGHLCLYHYLCGAIEERLVGMA